MERPAEFVEGRIISEVVARGCLKRCGVGVRIFAGCRLVFPDKIEVGDFSQIDEGVYVFAGEGVVLGAHVHLAFGSSISGGGRASIKDFASIGAGVRLITGSDLVDAGGLTNPTVPAEFRKVERGKIIVGAHAVVFTNSIVLPGTVIGDGAVVAAGSVVHHDLKPWAIYAGTPLVQVGERAAEPVLRQAAQLIAGTEGNH